MKLVLLQDRRGHFRWHLTAANGKIVAESGEGYVRLKPMLNMLRKIFADKAMVMRAVLRFEKMLERAA